MIKHNSNKVFTSVGSYIIIQTHFTVLTTMLDISFISSRMRDYLTLNLTISPSIIIIIIIIVGFIERTYLIETTTQGSLQHIITPTDLVKPLPPQLPWKHTRSTATGARP